jgi:Cu+-exporting ATPase
MTLIIETRAWVGYTRLCPPQVGWDTTSRVKIMIHHEDSQRSAAQQATLQVTGMTCASCVAHVERALRELPGVSQAIVNLATGTAKVEFDPSQVSLEQMAQAVREVGYEAAPIVEAREAVDREREARQREIKRQGFYLAFAAPLSAIIMLGTFRDYWIFPYFVPEWLGNKFLLGLLTTPIVFGPGRQFFVNSWRGLRAGVTDMNLLYATGIGARI